MHKETTGNNLRKKTMANKIGIVVDKIIKELEEDLLFKPSCLKLLEKSKFFDNPEEIQECELILD